MKKKTTTLRETQTRASQIPDTKKGGKAMPVTEENVLSLILRDHKPLKKFIETLKDAKTSRASKEMIFEQFAEALMSHAKAEENTLYVQFKDTNDLRVMGFEGDTEHGMAEQLVQEINGTPDDDEWVAKVKVLAEAVEHHILEEEGQMLPKAMAEIDEMILFELGAEYTRLKDECDSLATPPKMHKSKIVERTLN